MSKSSSHDIAQALVEMSRVIPKEDYAQACDSALKMLEQGGTLDMHHFPGRVLHALQVNEGVVFATLGSPTGDIGDQKAEVQSIIEKKTGKKVQLEQYKDPSLIGGAVLTIGDERYDVSIKGAIEQLVDHLLSSSALAAA